MLTSRLMAGVSRCRPSVLFLGMFMVFFSAVSCFAAAGELSSFVRKGKSNHSVNAVVISGDRDSVYALDGWHEFEAMIMVSKISDEDIQTIREKILKELQDEGFVFAKVSQETAALSGGTLSYRIDLGQVGSYNITGNTYYSAAQIMKHVRSKGGDKFNYKQLYNDLVTLNVQPDLKIDVKLKPRDERGKRIVDVDLTVKDTLPLHGAIHLSNTGIKETANNTEPNEWRIRTSVQYLNLTKHRDAISFDWLTDPGDTGTTNAFSGNYRLPFGGNKSISIFGGYAESDIDDVLPSLDINGEGGFFGGRFSFVLHETSGYSLDVSLGYIYQTIQNDISLAGFTFDDKKIELGLSQITLSYSDKEFDRFNGRTFFSNTIMINNDGQMGSSEESDFAMQRLHADGSFFISRLQLARLQKLGSGSDWIDRTSLFFKLNAQFTDEPLIAALQKGIGGANTVRGYLEREITGDEGFTATLEWRFPLMSNFIPGMTLSDEDLAQRPDAWEAHSAQWLAFVDIGYVHRNSPAAGVDTSDSIYSAGIGVRLNLTSHAQFRIDFGYPLEETVDSDDIWAHLAMQIQF